MGTLTIPEAKAGQNLKLEIRRVIRASRQRVFEAWTRPEEIRKWFGPAGTQVLEAEADVRQGGRWSISTVRPSPDGGEEHHCGAFGEYVTIVPNRLLRFTWTPTSSLDEETLVTIELQDVAGGTELTLRHEGFASENSRAGHEEGWTGTLVKLVARVEA